MKPILFHVGPLSVHAYGFTLLIAFLVGMAISRFFFKKKGIPTEAAYDLILIGMAAGIAGARFFFVLQYHESFDFRLFHVWDGLSWWGGCLGVLIFTACYKNISAFSSTLFSAVALGLAKYNRLPGTSTAWSLWDIAFSLFVLGLAVKNGPSVLGYLRKNGVRGHLFFGGGAAFFGLVGLRLFHCYAFASNYAWDVFALWKGGLVFYGGFLCVVPSLVIYLKKKRLPILRTLDVLTFALLIGLGITRIGCFLNGCCFGRPCNPGSIWAAHFPPRSLVSQKVNLRGLSVEYLWKRYAPGEIHYWVELPKGHQKALDCLKQYMPKEMYDRIFKPVYATQIISSLNAFGLFFLLLWFYPHRKYDGEVAVLFGVLYGMTRFSIEMWRFDTDPVLGTGLTAGQAVSVPLFCGSLALFLYFRVFRLRFAPA